MFKFRVLFIFIILSSYEASATRVKVVTSITPIASLVSMIAEDKVEISSIAKDQGCPHHYTMKPSDLKLFQNVDLFIYIDSKFDSFTDKIIPKIQGHILGISTLDGIRIENNNWHLWLLPKNAMIILESITQSLCAISQENQALFKRNLAVNLKKMEQLERERVQSIGNITQAVLLSDSAEYLFLDTHSNYEKFYQNYENLSIKARATLLDLKKKGACFIANNHNSELYRKLLGPDATIATISTENWTISNPLKLLYYREYTEILDTVVRICSTR